jgi:CRP/FNR family transcriptional regulator
VNVIDREALMKLLDKYGELGLHSAQALSREFQSAYRDIHELVLARSSAGKLAPLLLSWSGAHERDSACREIRIRSSMTHEEIAQMIGSSRETVTRLLSELKKKELICLEGSTFGHPQSTCVGGAGRVELLGSSKRAVVDANRRPPPSRFQEAMRLHVRD